MRGGAKFFFPYHVSFLYNIFFNYDIWKMGDDPLIFWKYEWWPINFFEKWVVTHYKAVQPRLKYYLWPLPNPTYLRLFWEWEPWRWVKMNLPLKIFNNTVKMLKLAPNLGNLSKMRTLLTKNHIVMSDTILGGV